MSTTEIKRIIEVTTGRSNQTIRELRDTIAKGREAMQDLDITSKEFAETSEQVTNAQTLLRNAVRGTTAAVEGSYNAYSAELSMLKKQRKELNENSQEYARLTARIVELNNKLSAMDAEIGVYGRNVGNYSSAFNGLNMETQQLVRELPSLTIGFNQFVLAISNNLPMFADWVKQVKEETGSFMATLKAVGTSLMSWNVLLVAAVTILANWDKIKGWINNLREGREELDATAKATKKLREELGNNTSEYGDAIVKVRQLSEAWQDLGDNMSAMEQFIRENATAFEELGVKVENVADAESLLVKDTDKFIAAMQARAQATAAMNLATEAYENVFVLEQQRASAPRYRKSFKLDENGKVLGFKDSKEYTKLTEQIDAAKAEADAFFALMTGFEQQFIDLMSGFKSAGKDSGGGGSDKMTFLPESIGSADADRIIAEMMAGMWRNLMPSQGITGGTASDADEVLKMELERNLAMLYANAEERIAIEEKYNERIRELRLQTLDDENARLEDQLTNQELSVGERAEIEDAITQNLIEQTELRLGAEERAAKKSEKIAKEEADAQIKIEKQKQKAKEAMLDASADLFGAASDMAKEGTKTQKGLATAEALINTYNAANKALSSFAPPASYIAMAATIATGLANVKAIWEVDETGQSTPDMSIANGVPPSVASSMPANYTRNLLGDSELTEMNKPIKAYVVESEATAQMELSKKREKSASF